MTFLFAIAFSQDQIHELKVKKESTIHRIEHVKALKHQIDVKQHTVSQHLIINQKRLEEAQYALNQNQQKLVTTKTQLSGIQGHLSKTQADLSLLSRKAGGRLRAIWMGERVSILTMILESRNISTLMDRIVYRQRIVGEDRKLIGQMKEKSELLAKQKNQLDAKQSQLTAYIGQVHKYQGQVNSAMVADRSLMSKLMTDKASLEDAERQLLVESSQIESEIQSLAMARRKRTHVKKPGGHEIVVSEVAGSTGSFAAPMSAHITSGFGYRFHPILHRLIMHTGVDFAGPYGGGVHAADGGQIIFAGWRGGYGKVIIIDHGDHHGQSITSLYGHLSGIAVGVGQTVRKGQVIGFEGSTGLSTGPHLHFEIREDGRPTNPLRYL